MQSQVNGALGIMRGLATLKVLGVCVVSACCVVTVLNAVSWQGGSNGSGMFATAAPTGGRAPSSTRIIFERDDPSRISETTLIDEKTDQLPAPEVLQQRPVVNEVETVSFQAPSSDNGDTASFKSTEETRRLQMYLSRLGHYGSDIDGRDGPETRNAVLDYIKASGHGISPNDTNALLVALSRDALTTSALPAKRPSVAVASETRADEAAMTADDIRRAQTALKILNDEITVDGVFGNQTRTAIVEFQALYGLPITGNVDAELFDQLARFNLL